VGNLSEVKTTFTIDLAPYLEGLKSMLTMTQQTGTQLKPLLNVQIDKADFSQIDKTLGDYNEKVKTMVPVAGEATQATIALGGAADVQEKAVARSAKTTEVHSTGLRSMKRNALESFGAMAFLTQSVVEMAASSGEGSKQLDKLEQGLNKGVSAGFGLAAILGTLGIASGGVAAAIGAVVTVGIAVAGMFDNSKEKAEQFDRVMKGFADTLKGASRLGLEQYRDSLNKQIETLKTLSKVNEHEIEDVTEYGVVYTKTAEVVKQNTEQIKLKVAELAEVEKALTATEKTHAEWRDTIRGLEVAGITNSYDRQRAEAQKWYEDQFNLLVRASEDRKSGNAIVVALDKQLAEKLIEIDKAQQQDRISRINTFNDQEKQIDEAKFEEKMSFVKISGMNLGVAQSDIDGQINTETLSRKKTQLAAELKASDQADEARKLRVANLMKDIAALQVTGEQNDIKTEEEKQQHLLTMGDLASQKQILLIQKKGAEQRKSEEQINVDVIAEKKKGIENDLKLVNDQLADGKQSDRKLLERKAQLEKDLIQNDLDGVNARKQLSEQESKAKMDAIQSIASNMNSTFSTLAQMQQTQTSKVLGDEKTKKQAALDAEKAKLLAAATTDAQKQKIEDDYAAKKTALDADMDAKAKAMNKAAVDRQKAMAIIAATISTYTGAASALKDVPVPFNFIAAAAVIAAGLADVAMINSQEVPGLAEGGKVTRPTYAMIGEAGTEIVAPEKSFIQVFKDDLAPRLIDVLLPQIKASVLAAIAVPAGGGGVVQYFYVTIPIADFSGSQSDFEKLKKTVEDAMRVAGTNSADSLFKNQKRT
jgi:hypothetical protein